MTQYTRFYANWLENVMDVVIKSKIAQNAKKQGWRRTMRLVDADALSKLVGEPIEVFLRRLDLKLPPTVDAVEVVRCKDCKFFRRYGFRLEYAECVNFDFYDTTEDGYCSWGERREDETD